MARTVLAVDCALAGAEGDLGRPLSASVRLHVRYRVLWLLAAVPGPAWANMGIPMLVLAWPAYWLALIPVIFFEGYLGNRIAGIPSSEAMKTSAVGNLWSTLLGIPIVWAILLALEMAIGIGLSGMEITGIAQWLLFPLVAAWLMPTENIWVVYAAFVVLAIPFCIASIWIETKVALKRLPQHEPQVIRTWIRNANIWSYVGIATISVVYPLLSR